MHTEHVCGYTQPSVCNVTTIEGITCERSGSDCRFEDWDLLTAIATNNTDPGSVAARAKDTTCAAINQGNCPGEQTSTDWCYWGSGPFQQDGDADRCTVNYLMVYTDLCKSSATYSAPKSSASASQTFVLATALAASVACLA